MFNMLKNTYCFYIAQIVLKCKNSDELDNKLDLLIDNNKINEIATGDKDLIDILKHVCNYRAFHRETKEYEVHTNELSSSKTEPVISNKILFRALKKSIF